MHIRQTNVLKNNSNLSSMSRAKRSRPENNLEQSYLVLIGGRSPLHMRLRAAQSIARNDLSLSHFSHVLLAAGTGKDASTFEVPLDQAFGSPAAPGIPRVNNGVKEGTLGCYLQRKEFPNYCEVGLPLPWTEVAKRVALFKKRWDETDSASAIWRWLGYLWAVPGYTNPLDAEIGVPSAVFVDAVVGSLLTSLTPNMPSLNASPEAIWQALKWTYQDEGIKNLEGRFEIGQRL